MDARFRSRCPIASSLDLLGDRWTLVVIRTLMAGATSYSDLLAAPEKIATNVLADRLGRLEASGLVSSTARRGVGKVRKNYRLTPAGADLLPVLQALSAWGEEHIPGRWRTPDWFKAARAKDFLPDGDESPRSEVPH